jgi:predicted Zn-dependent protease
MIHRRKFLCGCGTAALVGLGAPASGHIFRRKPKGFRCGVLDPAGNTLLGKKKWDREHFRYYVAGRDTDELTKEEWDGELKLAFDSWSAVTPLTFEQVEAAEEVDLVLSAGRRRREGFGRQGGVLAWAQLPPTRNYDGILVSKFDSAEHWTLPDSDTHGIVFRAVASHEIGHLLGLGHSDDPDSLMYPYITASVSPESDDIKKIQRLYGKPKEGK